MNTNSGIVHMDIVSRSAMVDDNKQHELLVAKIIAMVVLICITILCGGLPYLLNRCFKWTKRGAGAANSSLFVQCMLYFGGGVLICTTFMHMLPDVIEVVNQLQKSGLLANTPFSLPPMLMCTGFYLMYLLEEIMHTMVHRHQKKLSKKEALASAAFERGQSNRNSVVKSDERDKDGAADETSNGKTDPNCSNNCAPNISAMSQSEMQHQRQHEHHSHIPINIGSDDDDGINASMRGLGIILALSLHELFEGMALGLEGTVGTVWFMFGAIAAHKLILAFCVGMELMVAQTRKSLAIVYIITFAIVTPIGIGVGIAISDQANANQPSVPSGILQGIACGTLLYVIFFEILSKNHSGWHAYLASIIGFGVMFGLQMLADEAEDPVSDVC